MMHFRKLGYPPEALQHCQLPLLTNLLKYARTDPMAGYIGDPVILTMGIEGTPLAE